MDFEYTDNELDIIDTELPLEDNSLITLCKTMGGITIVPRKGYHIVEEMDGLYILKKRDKNEVKNPMAR